jgi:hypothetical protein
MRKFAPAKDSELKLIRPSLDRRMSSTQHRSRGIQLGASNVTWRGKKKTLNTSDLLQHAHRCSFMDFTRSQNRNSQSLTASWWLQKIVNGNRVLVGGGAVCYVGKLGTTLHFGSYCIAKSLKLSKFVGSYAGFFSLSLCNEISSVKRFLFSLRFW